MQPNPFETTPAPGTWPKLEKMNKPLHRVLAGIIHGGAEDSASRTVTATTLLLSLWQLAGRGMTHQVPSLVLVNSKGGEPGPMDALAAGLVTPQEDTGPRVHKDGPFAHGTPKMAAGAMADAILRMKERRQHAALPWVPQELQLLEDRFFAAQKTGFGYGPTRPYAKAWHNIFGLMTERDCQAILRLESISDHAAFREHVIAHPNRLRAALGYGPGLELVSKRICVSGTIAPGQWDAEFVGHTVGLGLPLLLLPNPVGKAGITPIQPALEVMTSMLPNAFDEPLEEPANLIEGEWFAHYDELLRTRLRMMPSAYDYAMQRMARQLFPVSLRLTSWAGRLHGASMRECEALALDLCAHALRGMVIGVTGLGWQGQGLDARCDKQELLRVLDYLRRKGPTSKSDLIRYGKVEKSVREPMLELFVAEDLARMDGKMVTATTYEEFVATLYSRKEFPEPRNHWTGVPGKADAA